MMRASERFSPAQCRAARALIAMPLERLAASAHLEPEAIELYESGEGGLSEGELGLLGYAFATFGVIAIPQALAGEGVRLREPQGIELDHCGAEVSADA